MPLLDPAIIKKQIDNLGIAYPELRDDDDDWVIALGSETDLDELLTVLVRRIEDARALVDGTDGRMKELQERQARFNRRIEGHRALILKLLQAANIQKRELPEATVSLRVIPPKVVGEVDAKTLPDELVIIERKPDKAAIKRALQEGRQVNGCQLSNGGEGVTIRIK